jgi:hypothetical protein
MKKSICVIACLALCSCKCDEPQGSISTTGALLVNSELLFQPNFSCGAALFKTCKCSEFTWDFGDGAISKEENPRHTYTSPKTYAVSVTVSNKEKSHTVSTELTITAQTSTVTNAHVYFWSDNLYPGEINVSLFSQGNNKITGSLTALPACLATETSCAAFRDVPLANYSYSATGSGRTWSGAVNASSAGCYTILLH